MSVATLDTHEVVKDLLSAGFTDEQAEAVARNLRKAQDLDLSAFATKVEVETGQAKLRRSASETEAEIFKWMYGAAYFIQTLIIIGAMVILIRPAHP